MTNDRRATRADVAERTAAAFRPSETIRLGAEVEWLVYDRDDPTRTVSASTTAEVAAGPLPADGSVTIEPGGQLELVTRPAPGPDALIDAIDADTRVLVDRFAERGLVLVPAGFDPVRPPQRTLDLPRYAAMERYFIDRTPAGVEMMNRTASLQLNIDFGVDPEATWALAHRIAPTLCAAFANSPTADGETFLPVSHRQRIWAETDPPRTRPVGDSPTDWERYVLGAEMMLRDDGNGGVRPLAHSTPLAALIDSDDPPTLAELDRHLTTLFPPIRPRGFLELRMLDAVPRDGRVAAITTVWAFLADPAAVADDAEHLATSWDLVLSEGLANPTVRESAHRLLAVAAERSTSEASQACERWRERIDDGPPSSVAEILATYER